MGSLLSPWTTNPWAGSLLLIIILVALSFPAVRVKAWWDRRTLLKRLSDLEFFHSLYVGRSWEHSDIEGARVWFDAPYTVVVKKDGKLMGLIGFDLRSQTLRVRQLQGLHGAHFKPNFKGVPVGHFLLPYAETIARKLGRSILWVQAAERNLYFTRESLEKEKLYAEQREHQRRMVKLYNTSALDRGYVRDARGPYLLGHYVRLRKTLTTKRYLRLCLVLLDRSIRAQERNAVPEPIPSTTSAWVDY
jgi:hypothetical protein